jgi:hypothetical protein
VEPRRHAAEDDLAAEIRVVANPARGGRVALSIRTPGGEPGRLELLDVRGRVVASQVLAAGTQGGHVFPVAGQPAGVYFVRALRGPERTVQKLVLIP